jgi:hypothetical protein
MIKIAQKFILPKYGKLFTDRKPASSVDKKFEEKLKKPKVFIFEKVKSKVGLYFSGDL